MPKGAPDGTNEPGWLDIAEYLAVLRSVTGRGWCVCIAATGELSKERAVLFSVCEYRAGAPIVRDDLALVSGAWPVPRYRRMEAAVLDMLYRFDRRLAEVEKDRERQSAF